MNSYYIPRNTKGEGRILFIFSTKALIYTSIGGMLGLLLNFILFTPLGIGMVGIVIAILLAVIGFIIATFKVPDTTAFEITRKTGGEPIDNVIKRAIKFSLNRNKVYVYTKEDTKDE